MVSRPTIRGGVMTRPRIPIDAKCFVCGESEPGEMHRHHWDWNHANNTPGNVKVVCRWCHVEIHRVGFYGLDELEELRVRLGLLSRDEVSARA